MHNVTNVRASATNGSQANYTDLRKLVIAIETVGGSSSASLPAAVSSRLAQIYNLLLRVGEHASLTVTQLKMTLTHRKDI